MSDEINEFEDFPEDDFGEESSPPPPEEPGPTFRERLMELRENRFVWQGGKILPAFWTIASTISMITTVVLIVVLVVLVRELFALKALIGAVVGAQAA